MTMLARSHTPGRQTTSVVARGAALALILLLPLLNAVTPVLAAVAPPAYVYGWGTSGAGEGEFNQPRGLTLDSAGYVYVVDTANYRCQKFEADGTFVTTWGSSGSGTDQFLLPWDVAVDSTGDVYVSDYSGNCVKRYTWNSGTETYGYAATVPGTFNHPAGIAVDANDNLYVADCDNHRVQKFDGAGAFITQWGSQGSGESEFQNATDVAVTPDGTTVYVADNNNYRVQKFEWNGTVYAYAGEWGTGPGSSDGEFNTIWGIALDSQENVYVADLLNHRIQEFDSSGTFLAKWGEYGSTDGYFRGPWGVAITAGGEVYVADSDNSRVQVFAPGPWVTFLGDESLDDAADVAVDSEGYVYVTGETQSVWSDPGDPAPVRPYSSGDYEYDAYVAKLSPHGDIVWYTFLGGGGNDRGCGIAVDSEYVYVTGRSDNYAWSQDGDGSPVREHSVSYDAFVARLDADDGGLDWYTFLGGNSDDTGSSVAVDSAGNVYVSGISEAGWTETATRGYTGGKDVFAAALGPSGSLTWHTFLGGSGNECLYLRCGIAVDSDYVYVAGNSPTDWGSGALREYAGGEDAFVAKLDMNNSGAISSYTFLGGYDGSDWGHDIVVDGEGYVYLAGYSDASWGVHPVQEHPGGNAVTVVKLTSSLGLEWNTFLGGGEAQGMGVAVDSEGNVYVAGASWGSWGSPENEYSGTYDAFAAMLSSSGDLIWNTFAGGGDYDCAFAVAVHEDGLVTMAGYSSNGGWAADPVRDYSDSWDGLVLQVQTLTSVSLDLDLEAGWNMISVPVTVGGNTVAEVFAEIDPVAIYTWNAGDGCYDELTGTDVIEPQRGYWVAVTEEDTGTLTLTGVAVDTWEYGLSTGWNMIGSVYGPSVDPEDLNDGGTGYLQTSPVYWWSPESGEFGTVGELEQGRGYWIMASQDCTVTMTAP